MNPPPDPTAPSSTAQPAEASHRLRNSLIVTFLVLAIAVVTIGLLLSHRQPETQLQGMVDTDTISIATKVPSRIEKLYVEEGQHVAAGDPLVALDSSEVTAMGVQAAALLQSALALQGKADTGARAETGAALKNTWQAAEANAVLAQKTFERFDALFREGVISEQRRDEAQAAMRATRGLAEAARQNYQAGESGADRYGRDLADSLVSFARATLNEADSLKGETLLTAPGPGEISKRLANPGELVLPGVPIYTLINLDDLWVSFHIREDSFHGLKLGDVLTGDVPALDATGVRFKVSYIAPEGDFATWQSTRQSSGYDVRSFEVRARAQQVLPGLRPGMSVLVDRAN